MNTHFDFPSYIDSSMLATYKSCPQKFFRTYIQHWKPKALSVHLHAGKAFALALEVTRKCFYEGGTTYEKRTKTFEDGRQVEVRTPIKVECTIGDSETAIVHGMKALFDAYGDFECPPDSAKSLERMSGAFEFYWDHYPLILDETTSPILLASGRRAIEFSFSEPIDVRHPTTGDPILYVGKMDSINNFAGGVYINDEKTTTQLGASWSKQWDLRGQFTGYGWGCQRVGIRVDGAVIRGISILKTKYDTQQAITYRPEWQIDRWYDETCAWIEAMIADWKRQRFLHNFAESCADFGGCGFVQICSTQTPDPWLETNFERRVWNPVLHEETVLLP